MPKTPLHATGTTLLRKVAAKELDPTTLVTSERRAIVSVLFGPGAPRPNGRPYTQEEAADLLCVSRVTIGNDLSRIRSAFGHLVMREDMRGIVGELCRKREIAQHAAIVGGNWPLYWQVEREYVECLQRLGIVATAPTNVNVQGRLAVGHGFSEFGMEQVEKLLTIAAADRAIAIAAESAESKALDMPAERDAFDIETGELAENGDDHEAEADGGGEGGGRETASVPTVRPC